MTEFMGGLLTMGYLVAGLHFLRFHKRTRDALFLYFAIAFWILAAQRGALALVGPRFEDDTVFYVARLAAFVLILIAIWQKNRPRPAS